MVVTPHSFSIRITDTRPEHFAMTDLADVVHGLDKAIRGLVGPEEAPKLTMGLVGIRTGSLVVDIASTLPVAIEALTQISEAVTTRRPEMLPPNSRAGLQQILPVLRRNIREDSQPSLHLILGPDDDAEPKAVITPDMDFAYVAPKARGETVVYGQLIWIGGEHPRAHVRLETGKLLNCVVSKSLAQILAPRLYHIVGLEGEAEWNTEDWSITEFRITGATPFRESSVIDAVDALAEATEDAWLDVEDVNLKIARIRQENSQ
ncbi:MAG TPA: hypothetical protein VD902_22195 [Symbiobacteriaceae bacterium]|nr:hypothetical protein [Symbiobacteriaceae bacterium]